MIKKVEIKQGMSIEDYALYSSLYLAINELKTETQALEHKNKGKKVWMINSTEQGGGVAEMLPRMVSLFRQLGIEMEWVVMGTDEQHFFEVTKNIHNLIHGKGDPELSEYDRTIYEKVNFENAEHLLSFIDEKDIIIIHDPQPMAMAKVIKEKKGNKIIWRCHIGLGEMTKETQAAWEFLRPYFEYVDHSIFSAPEYIPNFLSGHVSVIHPGIDPLSHKNRPLSAHKLVGILCNSGLMPHYNPVICPDFKDQARRLHPNGNYVLLSEMEDLGLLFRPMVTQVSRWDRLKGFKPLMEAFVFLKTNREIFGNGNDRHRKRLDLCRLILAGPDPESVKDDPEGQQVLNELKEYYQSLSEKLQKDIALLVLPMASVKENALIVNALQRCSSIVVQNSIQEGFGLTASEAMWKSIPILGSSAVGLRQQIREDVDGMLVKNPENVEEVAHTLNEMLSDPKLRETWAQNAQKRVMENFLVFNQIREWLKVLASLAEERKFKRNYYSTKSN